MPLLRALMALICVAVAFAALPARAQTVTTYSNTTTGAINATTTCTAPLVRNFTVATSYTVGDVDLAMLAAHTWRGDLRVTLQSPAGTRVQLVNGDTNNTSGDNFNVRLDDNGTQTVNTDGNTVAHSTTAPPYQNQFSPNAALSAFNGENSAGTWRLEVCDQFPSQDNGSFTRADLYLTSMPSTYADLSLTKTVSNASPTSGAAISYTLNVTSSAASPSTATGVTVQDILPPGFTFTGATGFGTYNSGTGVWTVGSIPPNTTRSLTISGTVNASNGATVTNIAEITASSVIDIDSTPNNGAAGEDDYASRSFTVTGTRAAGVAPSLTCPAGTSLFDWNAITWAAGSVNNSYAQANIGTIAFALTNPATWVNDAAFGGQSPTNAARSVNTSANDGGFPAAERSLHLYIDFATPSQMAQTVITLPTAVPGAQFRIFDVDFAANDFADKLVITGYFGATAVFPTLTNGVSNYVAGNVVVGDAASANTSADGNVVVTFAAPIDRIVIDYGNHTTAPANPDGQAVSLHDINFCRPVANLTITKTSSVVSDPTNGTTNPKAIPGATMRYCILVTNNGSGTATGIAVTDPLPATATYVPGSLISGASCAAATTAEDDNATGADESDPFGASRTGTTIAASTATLTPGAAMAIAFQVLVN